MKSEVQPLATWGHFKEYSECHVMIFFLLAIGLALNCCAGVGRVRVMANDRDALILKWLIDVLLQCCFK